MNARQMRLDRDRKAEAMGEGMWCNNATNQWHRVDASFYPKPQLWIYENPDTDKGPRRKITRAELDRDFHQIEL